MQLTAEEQLQKAMLDTYHLNILFLSEFDNELFLRVTGLSNLIASGEYKERFFLEFLKDKGDFDIYDSKNDTFLYEKEPKKFNNKAVVQTNFDMKNSICTLDPNFYNHPYKKDFENLEDDPSIFSREAKRLMNDLFKIKKTLDYKIDKNIRKIDKIDKFMFVGTLLGRHIPKILKKIKAKTFLVCENNLEIFRLSLFVCDYSELAVEGRRVIFSVMDDDDVIMRKVLNFTNMDVYNNSIIKYYSTNYNVRTYYDRILDRILSLSPMSFNYYMHLDNVVKSFSDNFFKYKTLSFKEGLKLDSLKDKKVLFLAPGPSLLDNIDWVIENKDKFIIVTMAASLTTLFKYKIKPDIITTLDPQAKVSKQFYKDENSKEFLKDCIIFASLNTNAEVLKELNETSKLYLYEVLGSITNDPKPLMGNSVGEITFSIISKFLNIQEVYLLGTDLAANKDTGRTHGSNYEYGRKLKIPQEEKVQERFSYRGSVVKIKGNLEKEVYTSRLFYGSLRFYNAQMKNFNKKVYNFSTHGAYIDNTTALKFNDFDTKNLEKIDKDIIFNTLQEDLNKYIITSLDNENLKSHVNMVQNLVNKLNEKHSVSSYHEFNKLSNEAFLYVSENKNKIYFINEIFVNYTLTMNPYISYCYLVKDKKDKINLDEVYIIWRNKLVELLEKYIKYFNNLIDHPNP